MAPLTLLFERARCPRCGGRCFLDPEAPDTRINDRWVYACVSCARTRKETDDEVLLRTGMESQNAERARVSAEIRGEQAEKRRKRKVKAVA